jgi:hypothetical protein
MIRSIKLLVLTGTLLAVSAGSALAASPHFIGTPQATVSGNTLTVTFKAAGLGNVDEATFSLSGSVEVSSRCYTKSGNKPQAANKQEIVPVSVTDTFPVRNGQTTGSLSFTPLSSLKCPPGQITVIESVDFSNLVLSGEGLIWNF